MIYVDNAATTKLDPRVLEEMLPCYQEDYGNPSAVYSLGSKAKKVVALGRKRVAEVIGAQPEEIVFTSGGSESDNWALFSAARNRESRGRHVITTKIEHHAVLNTCHALEKQGFITTETDPDDRRHKKILPTDKALSLKEELAQKRKENEKRMTDGFSEKELKQLNEYLQRIYANNNDGRKEECKC